MKSLFPPSAEWCGFMRNQKSNRITKAFTDSFSKSIPQLFKQCPLKDKLNLNISITGKITIAAMMLPGVYQFYMKTHNDVENPIFEMSVLLKIGE
jgi:hypothetical protein